MRRIHYAQGSVLAADSITTALFGYAHALALSGTSDLVLIPVVDDEGTRGVAQFLIGPASQMMSTPAPGAGTHSGDAAVVDLLDRRARAIQLTGPNWPRSAAIVDDADHGDLGIDYI